MTLRERAAKALGCYPLQVRFKRGPWGWAALGKPFQVPGVGPTQAAAVADLERKAQARQEVKP